MIASRARPGMEQRPPMGVGTCAKTQAGNLFFFPARLGRHDRKSQEMIEPLQRLFGVLFVLSIINVSHQTCL